MFEDDFHDLPASGKITSVARPVTPVIDLRERDGQASTEKEYLRRMFAKERRVQGTATAWMDAENCSYAAYAMEALGHDRHAEAGWIALGALGYAEKVNDLPQAFFGGDDKKLHETVDFGWSTDKVRLGTVGPATAPAPTVMYDNDTNSGDGPEQTIRENGPEEGAPDMATAAAEKAATAKERKDATKQEAVQAANGMVDGLEPGGLILSKNEMLYIERLAEGEDGATEYRWKMGTKKHEDVDRDTLITRMVAWADYRPEPFRTRLDAFDAEKGAAEFKRRIEAAKKKSGVTNGKTAANGKKSSGNTKAKKVTKAPKEPEPPLDPVPSADAPKIAGKYVGRKALIDGIPATDRWGATDPPRTTPEQDIKPGYYEVGKGFGVKVTKKDGKLEFTPIHGGKKILQYKDKGHAMMRKVFGRTLAKRNVEARGWTLDAHDDGFTVTLPEKKK